MRNFIYKELEKAKNHNFFDLDQKFVQYFQKFNNSHTTNIKIFYNGMKQIQCK